MSDVKVTGKLTWYRRVLLLAGVVAFGFIPTDAILRTALGLGNPILYQYSPKAGYVLAPNHIPFSRVAPPFRPLRRKERCSSLGCVK